MELDRNGLEVLDRDDCLRLLSQQTLGRIALSVDARPTVLPVNFVLAEDRILVLTARGSKLDAASRNAVVAFEVDDLDPVYHSGWSVVVSGRAHQVTDPAELEAARRSKLTRWAPWNEACVIAVEAETVSGRRIAAGVPPDPHVGT